MKLNILFGGASYEHEISIVSAITLQKKLQDFELSFIFCDEAHNFYLIDANDMKAKYFASYEYKKAAKLTLTKGGFEAKKLFGSAKIDGVVLNLIHGADGEDGVIAGVLDFFEISYIGPRIDASVLSFDKRYTKAFAKELGIAVLEYEVLFKNSKKEPKTPFPLIIKPARLGSSIGVSVVKEQSELDYALDVAFEFDDVVIVEPFIARVKEYNLAGYSTKEGIVFSKIEEPQKKEFLDFEKKYMDFSRTEDVFEAQLNEKLTKKLQDTFAKIYKSEFAGALIRCDFFVIENQIYLNEINPIPGSMANYLFDDFSSHIKNLAQNLPKKQGIAIKYQYIHSISKAKGK